jgi:hypothetical protein
MTLKILSAESFPSCEGSWPLREFFWKYRLGTPVRSPISDGIGPVITVVVDDVVILVCCRSISTLVVVDVVVVVVDGVAWLDVVWRGQAWLGGSFSGARQKKIGRQIKVFGRERENRATPNKPEKALVARVN